MPWLSITFEADAAPAEALSEALIEAGAESVGLEPVADAAAGRTRVSALAATDANPGLLVAAAARAAALPAPAFRVERVEDDDWVRRSQSQFGPIRVSPSLWILPGGPEPRDPSAIVVRLAPGLAFGTGGHVSTRLILERLGGPGGAWLRGQRVLDYGCGSGILAIVAAKFGAAETAAVDIDPQALETTAANARTNGVRLQVALPESLPPGTYDVVLANILAGPLIALEPLLAARTRPGGRIFLSGILQTQAQEVAAAYGRYFETVVGPSDEGWALVEGRRR